MLSNYNSILFFLSQTRLFRQIRLYFLNLYFTREILILRQEQYRIYFYILPHAVALGGAPAELAYSTRVLFKTQSAFYSRRHVRISCETHLHARENNFTARPGRAVIAFVIIAALLDLVPYSQKIRPCHRTGRAKIDIPCKKRLNEQEHVREQRTCRTHFSSHVERPPVISNCKMDVFADVFEW